MKEQAQFKEFLKRFTSLIFGTPGLTHVACHEIDTGNASPVFSKPYRYDKIKQGYN